MFGGTVRRPLRIILGILVVAAVTFGLCEIGLRCFMADVRPFVKLIERTPGEEYCHLLIPESDGAYEGALLAIEETEVHINSRGWRDREFAALAGPGVLRVALQGDSVVFGLGSQIEDCIARQLEEMLGELLKRPVEVINAGVPGYDLHQMIALFPRLVDDYHPNVVVFLFSPVDLVDQPCAAWHEYHRALASRSAVVQLATLAFHSATAGAHQELPENHVLVRALERELAELSGHLRKLGPSHSPRVLIAEDSVRDLGPDGWWEQTLSHHGLGAIELGKVMHQIYSDPERCVIANEGHPNREGYRLLATALADYLVASLPETR